MWKDITYKTMAIERSDKKKNIDKVATSLLKSPLQSQREVAEDTWISKSAVNRNIKEMGQNGTKDDRVVNLTDKDFNCIALWVAEIERRLQDVEELKKMRTPEISSVIKENTARYTLFRWTATDEEWGLKLTSDEIDNTPLDEVKLHIQSLINKKK